MYAKAGRPSVDPDVFFKLQLGMFFENVRSERQLMRVVADRISVCWHLGYDLYESLPDHSSLTRIRDRYGLEIFGRFFEWIVEMYAEAGLVWGEELGSLPTSADAELVCANTARSDWISKAGRQDRGVKGNFYRRKADLFLSKTDPDASPMNRKGADHSHLGYQTHCVVDGGKARIILGVLVTPFEVTENKPMLDMLWRCAFRWKSWPR